VRTTLTLDQDVEKQLRQKMRRTGKAMKVLVNEALRLGLGMKGKPAPPARFEVEPHAFGFEPGVDLDRLNQLVDELEAEGIARKLKS
jgi:hypothetical protein